MVNPPDRRLHPRRRSHGLLATIGQGFGVRRMAAEVLDFNRHGMSLRIPRALPARELVDIQLEFESLQIHGIVGVIHNCRCLIDGTVRCGIQFRTTAKTQLDGDKVRAQLARLEEAIVSAHEATFAST